MTSLSESKWAAVHAKPAGPGDARPTALDIIQDEGLTGQWADKVILITGASNGIGVETARALHTTGAHLFLPVRDVKKGQAVADDIVQKSGGRGGKIDVLQMDLNSLASVRKCAAEVLGRSKQLHVLICNAGVMASPEGRTEDGFETQFGVDHLAHFQLFQLLKDTLLSSSTPAFQSRVIAVSSSAHNWGEVNFGDYDMKKTGYDKWKSYGQAKTANVYMANEIERRYGSQGLHALSLMPGAIMTGLQVHVTKEDMALWPQDPELPKTFKSTAQGASTTVWAATSKVWEGKGGRYLEDCHEAEPAAAGAQMAMVGHAPYAYDEAKAKQLWEDSLKMIAA